MQHLLMADHFFQLACILSSAAVFSCGLTLLARWLAPAIGFVDRPDGERKLQSQPVSLMGGLAIYISALGGLGFASWIARASAETQPLLPLFGSAGLCCLIGLWDDRQPLRAVHKFLLQVLACLPFAVWGQSTGEVSLMGLSLHLGVLGLPLTVLWLVACTNIVNLLDGSDGLASTVGLIAMLAIAAMALVVGEVGILLAAVVLTGSLIGFLIHNWPPARIYLGDAGSLTIGFFVGAMTLQVSKTDLGFAPIPAIALLGIPALDAGLAILRRKLSGRSIGAPDHGHIHHCLLSQGYSKIQIVSAVGGLTALLGLSTVVAIVVRSDVIAAGTSCLVIGAVVGGRVFGYHEAQLLQRRLRFAFGDAELLFQPNHGLRNSGRPATQFFVFRGAADQAADAELASPSEPVDGSPVVLSLAQLADEQHAVANPGAAPGRPRESSDGDFAPPKSTRQRFTDAA